MVAAAEAAGKHYAVIQNRRYLPGIRQVRQALADGLIGEISAIHADFFRGPRFGGFREEMRHVLLVDMAIHSFDQARFLSGLDARHVNCHESNPPESWFAHGASATAIFEMENQAVFTYRGSWVAQGLPTNWECAWRILGSRGTLLWDGADEIRLATVPRGAPAGENSAELIDVPSRAWDPADNGHAGVIREFIRCLRTGETPLTHGRDNLKSLAMVFAAVASAESHAWVEVAG
jgi:predicted dehydrogenase